METITVTVGRTAYSIVAVQNDEGSWRPGVAVVDATGEPVTTVVDAETTDEAYATAKTCLLHAVAHVL